MNKLVVIKDQEVPSLLSVEIDDALLNETHQKNTSALWSSMNKHVASAVSQELLKF